MPALVAQKIQEGSQIKASSNQEKLVAGAIEAGDHRAVLQQRQAVGKRLERLEAKGASNNDAVIRPGVGGGTNRKGTTEPTATAISCLSSFFLRWVAPIRD